MNTKKVLLLCTEDAGGAGKATVELLTGLLNSNYETILLVKKKTANNDNIIQYKYRDKKKGLPSRFFSKIRKHFFGARNIATNPEYYFYNEAEKKHYLKPQSIIQQIGIKPDIIISTWTAGFLNFKTLAVLSKHSGAKVFVWTVDMAALTGGCHYAWSCRGFIHNCENCPAIVNAGQKKIAQINLTEKRKWINVGNLIAFGGSEFTQKQISTSSLFKEKKLDIYFSGFIDQNVFNPRSREIARKSLGIPLNKKIIFAGAINTTERRKGFSEFINSLVLLDRYMNREIINNTILILVGKATIPGKNPAGNNIPIEIFEMPFIDDEKIFSLYYQAADVFVCPSIEDSGPQMTLQALACGTPVVTFNIGFGYDIVQSGYNGFSSPVGNLEQFAVGIKSILELSQEKFRDFSLNAVKTIDKRSSLNALQNFIEKL